MLTTCVTPPKCYAMSINIVLEKNCTHISELKCTNK